MKSGQNLVNGHTAHGQNGESSYKCLKNNIGEKVIVDCQQGHFSGEITEVEPRKANGTTVGAKVTIDKDKLGGTVELSTYFRDDDFEDGDYIELY